MQLSSSIDSFPCFTRLNPCVAHCSTDSIPWVHHSREEGSLDYDRGFVRLQIHMNFDTTINRQQRCGGRCGGWGRTTVVDAVAGAGRWRWMWRQGPDNGGCGGQPDGGSVRGTFFICFENVFRASPYTGRERTFSPGW
jgi:hypothetical protein